MKVLVLLLEVFAPFVEGLFVLAKAGVLLALRLNNEGLFAPKHVCSFLRQKTGQMCRF